MNEVILLSFRTWTIKDNPIQKSCCVVYSKLNGRTYTIFKDNPSVDYADTLSSLVMQDVSQYLKPIFHYDGTIGLSIDL